MNDSYTVKCISAYLVEDETLAVQFKVTNLNRKWSKGMVALFLESLEKFPSKAVKANDLIFDNVKNDTFPTEMKIVYFIGIDTDESISNIKHTIEQALAFLEADLDT